MKTTFKQITLGAILALLFIGCSKAPITGRNQFITVTPQQELALGFQSAKQVLEKEKVSTDLGCRKPPPKQMHLFSLFGYNY
jgi:hypothetical protein